MPSVDCLAVSDSGTVPRVTFQDSKLRSFVFSVVCRRGYRWLFRSYPEDANQTLSLVLAIHNITPDASDDVNLKPLLLTAMKAFYWLARDLGFIHNRESGEWSRSAIALVEHAQCNWQLDAQIDARQKVAFIERHCSRKEIKLLCCAGRKEGSLGQVAAQLGISKPTARRRARLAKQYLKFKLEGYIS